MQVSPAEPLTTLADAIRAKHRECTEATTRTDALWFERAALLTQAKALVPHGQWIPWLKTKCGLSARQGQNYLRLANANHRDAHLNQHKDRMAQHRASKQRNSPPPQREEDPDAQADEEWCRAKEREVPDTATDEKRAGDEAVAVEMIEAGFRALAKRCHPDVGGTHLKMVQLSSVKQRILTLINGGF